jgi:hypothetical protein
MMEAASTSETSVNVYQTTRRNNPEGSHTRRRENLKSNFHCRIRNNTTVDPVLSQMNPTYTLTLYMV